MSHIGTTIFLGLGMETKAVWRQLLNFNLGLPGNFSGISDSSEMTNIHSIPSSCCYIINCTTLLCFALHYTALHTNLQ